MRHTATAVAALLAASASAQPITFTIDQAQSQINVTGTATTPVGSDTDSASSDIAGTIDLTIDNPAAPAQITINDFIFALTSNPALNFSFGALGSANATHADALATYATPGTPTGPVPVANDDFSFAAVSTTLAGTTNFDYSFFLVGTDSGSIDLATLGANDAPFNGTITSDGTTITLSATLVIDATQTLVDGIADVQLDGTATVVATAPVPAGPTPCSPADLAMPFDIIDIDDVDAFIGLFLAGDPTADIAAPFGIVDIDDVDAFIAAFLAGCP